MKFECLTFLILSLLIHTTLCSINHIPSPTSLQIEITHTDPEKLVSLIRDSYAGVVDFDTSSNHLVINTDAFQRLGEIARQRFLPILENCGDVKNITLRINSYGWASVEVLTNLILAIPETCVFTLILQDQSLLLTRSCDVAKVLSTKQNFRHLVIQGNNNPCRFNATHYASLQSIRFENCSFPYEKTITAPDRDEGETFLVETPNTTLSSLSGAASLESLTFLNCRLKSLSFLRLMPLFKTLKVYNDNLEKESFESLKNIPHVKTIALENCNLNSVPRPLLYCKKLEILSLRYNPLDRADYSNLTTLTNLQTLDLSFTGMRVIPQFLLQHPSLANLSLEFTHVKESPREAKPGLQIKLRPLVYFR